ncbi:hypothetical protein A9762_22420 [Pandoraea sp. ISTKB]|nr:hypothetical protein A9762_22420 [Pandoraea sp. ISTKB]
MIVLGVVLTACSIPSPSPLSSLPMSQTPVVTNAASELTGWYNRVDRDCGSANRAAFLCSGVLLRGTETNPAFLPWDPSPNAVQKGGIAFFWLRTDNNYSMLPEHPNGFVFYPNFYIPPGTLDIEVLCAFPEDGDTWDRPTMQGCGPHINGPQTSRPCDELGITTAQQWIAHLNQGAGRHDNQCGWTLRLGASNTADRFYQNILARNLLTPARWAVWNELVLKTWATGQGRVLPIHSFYYQNGNANALANARSDQTRYYQAYQRIVPIVRLTLPTNSAGKATFGYSDSDQAISPDGLISGLTPSVREASENNGSRLLISDFYERDFVTIVTPAYPGMAAGQTVGARWKGPSVTFDTPIKTVTTPGTMTFEVPRVEVIDAIGSTVPVTFSVKRGNAPIEQSAPLNLEVERQSLTLPAPTFNGASRELSVSFAGGQNGQLVRVRWSGVVVRDTTPQNVVPGQTNRFAIPENWVTENAGKTVNVNYSIGTQAGDRYQFSKILRLSF